MKYLKTFEIMSMSDHKDKDYLTLVAYLGIDEILEAVNYLKDRDVEFDLFYVDDNDSEENVFIILININQSDKLSHYMSMGQKSYVIEIGDDEVFLNLMNEEDIEYNTSEQFDVYNKEDMEKLEMLINTNKYNI